MSFPTIAPVSSLLLITYNKIPYLGSWMDVLRICCWWNYRSIRLKWMEAKLKTNISRCFCWWNYSNEISSCHCHFERYEDFPNILAMSRWLKGVEELEAENERQKRSNVSPWGYIAQESGGSQSNNPAQRTITSIIKI